ARSRALHCLPVAGRTGCDVHGAFARSRRELVGDRRRDHLRRRRHRVPPRGRRPSDAAARHGAHRAGRTRGRLLPDRRQDRVLIPSSSPGLWSLVSRLWSVVPGLCSVVSGPWSLVRGPWSLVPGLWSLVPGPWSVVCLSVVCCPWSVVRGPWSVVRGL